MLWVSEPKAKARYRLYPCRPFNEWLRSLKPKLPFRRVVPCVQMGLGVKGQHDVIHQILSFQVLAWLNDLGSKKPIKICCHLLQRRSDAYKIRLAPNPDISANQNRYRMLAHC